MTLALRLLVSQTRTKYHEDLMVSVNGHEFVCDSYYLLLDPGKPGEDPAKVRAVLGMLLDRWIAALDSLRDGEVIFLCFDFSDEFTRWLQARATGPDIELAAGSSRIEGWSVNPSDAGACKNRIDDWEAETEWSRIARADLCATLLEIRSHEVGTVA